MTLKHIYIIYPHIHLNHNYNDSRKVVSMTDEPIKGRKQIKKKLSPKHEIMAIARSKGSTKTEAYQLAYPSASYDSARTLGTNVIAKNGIDERALQLLARNGLTEDKLASRLSEHVYSDTESISLDATKTGLKLIGYGKEDRQAEQSYNPVNIQINIMPNPENDK